MSHNGGLLQVNIDYATPYNVFWALNALRMAYAFDGRDNSNVVVNENWPLNLDADGYPQAMPGGTATQWYMPQLWIYGEVGDTWDMIYPTAKATMILVSGTTGFSLSSASITGGTRYTITAVPTPSAACYLCSLRITAMSSPILAGELSLHRTEYQSRVTAGEWFDPRFLALLDDPEHGGTRGFGKVRWMTGHDTNASMERSAANRKVTTRLSWIRGPLCSSFWAGTNTKSLNALTTSTRIPTLPTSWSDGQVIQFRMSNPPTSLASTNITRGATTTIQFTTNHGMSNGNLLSFANTFNSYPSGWTAAVEEKQAVTGLPSDFAVTVTGLDTVTIPLNSSGFAALPSATFWPAITISDGTLPAKRMYSTMNVVNPSTGTFTANRVATGVYNSKFDCVVFVDSDNVDGLSIGIPVEAEIAVANKINAHLSYTFPCMANQDYRQTVAAVIKSTLNSGLTAYFETDNEPWLSSFAAYRYNRGVGAQQTGGSPDHRYGHHEKCMDMKSDVATVFGSDRPYKIAFNFQNAAGGGYQGWLEGNPAIHGGNTALMAGNNIDSFEVAPYYLTKFNYSATAADYTGYKDALNDWLAGRKDDAFDWMAAELISGPSEPSNTNNQQIDDNIDTFIPGHFTALASYTGRTAAGIELQCYEGSIHTVGPDQIDGGFPVDGITVQNVRDFYFEYLESAQQAYVEAYYFQNLLRLGVKFPSRFTVSGPWTNAQTWGSQRFNTYPVATTRQHTMLRRLNDGKKLMRLQCAA